MDKDVIDLSEYAKTNGDRELPKGQKYKFKVKNQVYIVDVEQMTGRDICIMADLIPPENYILDMKMHGGVMREVKLDEVISFIKPGIENFTYVARSQTEG